jgi:cytochrome c553
MKRLFRWVWISLAALLAILLATAAWVWLASAREMNRTHVAAAEPLAPPSVVANLDGERLARVLGCFSCHGDRLQGRLMFEEPGVARIWATNLSELAPRVSDQQLAAAIRQGIGADGRGLLAMPSAQYSSLSDIEVTALIRTIRAQPQTGGPVPKSVIGPIGRIGLATGRFRTGPQIIPEHRARPAWDFGAMHQQGRHIAVTACSGCHGSDLGGGEPEPDVVAPGLAMVGAYDLEQFRRLLRTGRAPHGRDLGLMREVAIADFSHLTDQEIGQLHGYLVARSERVAD